METKVEHKLRVGDVFLESDGWGYIVGEPGITNSDKIIQLFYINKRHVASQISFYRNIESVDIKVDDKFLFNMCDIFEDAKNALNGH